MANTTAPQALLLLPAPSSPASLRPAFGPTLSHVLPFLANSVKDTQNVARLDLGIMLPKTFSTRMSPRASVFPRVQDLLEDMYTLLCMVAVETGVEMDIAGGIDARIFMFEDQSGHPADRASVNHSFSGPVIDLTILVASGRSYDPVFSLESEAGEGVLKEFLRLHGLHNTPAPNVQRTVGGTSVKVTEKFAPELRRTTAHKSVAVGGTFDHLHIGHKVLLTATALVMEPETDDTVSPSKRLVTIGITGDELLKNKKYADQVESWEERQEKTAEFFESIVAFSKDAVSPRTVEHIDKPGPNGKLVRVQLGPTLTINYVQIEDPYGPTITDETISALVVSKETKAGGQAVNDKRAEKGWVACEVFEVAVLDTTPEDGGKHIPKETFESKISSTEIRRRMAAQQTAA